MAERGRRTRADLSVEVASRFEYVDVLEDLATAYATGRGLPDDDVHDFGVAVRESVTNAIRHGSHSDPAGRVKLELGGYDGTLVARVRDDGPGFDPAAILDPLAPENLPRGSGRGIFFMRRFTDRVSFSFPRCGGTVVCLVKRVAAATRACRRAGQRRRPLRTRRSRATPRAPGR